jgi:hypothetical protein
MIPFEKLHVMVHSLIARKSRKARQFNRHILI